MVLGLPYASFLWRPLLPCVTLEHMATTSPPTCPVCRQPVSSDNAVTCHHCGVFYHADCRQYARTCSIFGCEPSARTEQPTNPHTGAHKPLALPLNMPSSHFTSAIQSLLILAGVSIMLFNCAKSTSESDLIGTYVADHQVGSERLTLTADHKFVQSVTLYSTRHTLTTSGAWNFSRKDSRICFAYTFMQVVDGFRHPVNPPHYCTADWPVTHFLGLQIGGSPAIVYTKQ